MCDTGGMTSLRQECFETLQLNNKPSKMPMTDDHEEGNCVPAKWRVSPILNGFSA